MPINFSPYAGYGISALAGQNMPQLNLKPISFDIGAQDRMMAEGLLLQRAEEQKKQELANALYIAQLKEQGASDREILKAQVSLQNNQATNQTNRENNILSNQVSRLNQGERTQLGYDRLAQEGQIEGKKFELDSFYKQNQIELEKQKLMEQAIKNEFERKFQLSGRNLEIQNKVFGGLASLIQQNKDPAAIEAAKGNALKLLKQSGMDDESLNEIAKADPNQLMGLSLIHSDLGQKAINAKAAGININIGKEGDVNQEPTPANTTDMQKDVIQGYDSLRELEQIGNDYSKSYLTLGGAATEAVGNVASYLNVPGFTNQEKFVEDKANWKAQVERFKVNYIKSMSGLSYTDKQFEALSEAIIDSEKNTDAEFRGKMRSILNFTASNIMAKQQMLQSGIPLNEKEKEQKFLSLQSKILSDLNSIDKEYSSEDLSYTAQQTGLSITEVKQRLLEKKQQKGN